MLKLLATLGILGGLLLLALTTLTFGMLVLAFSTDGIRSADKLPERVLLAIGIVACGFLLYATITATFLFWRDASWGTIFWHIKIGWAGAIAALFVDWIIILKIAASWQSTN